MGVTNFDAVTTSGAVTAGSVSSGAVAGTTGAFTTSVTIGSAGTAIKQVKAGTISVVLAATAAAAEEDVSLTITGVAAGDLVLLSPLNASMETGVATVACWVSAANTVKLRISNVHTSSLTGSTNDWTYVWFDLT